MSLCDWFGHKPRTTHGRPVYGDVRPTAVDNVGRHHADVLMLCARCEQMFVVCHIHLPYSREDEYEEWQRYRRAILSALDRLEPKR
jgi:hypothetical protein